MKRGAQMASIREIASKAKVSPATVSRVLNNDPTISVTKETRKRVFDTAEKLKYIPVGQRAIKKNASIGIITTVSKTQEIDDPYFRLIRRGIETEAARQKLAVNRVMGLTDPTKNWDGLEKLGTIIVIGSIMPATLKIIYERNSNLIVIDDPSADIKYDAVYSDLKNDTFKVLDHLEKNGHKDIAFIGGKKFFMDELGQPIESREDNRFEAYQEWMIRHKYERYLYAATGGWGPLEGLDLTRKMLHERIKKPSAILVASDPMAVGVLRALQQENIRIPEDIALVSFDDIEISSFLTPSLSTVKIEMEELGRTAARLANDRIRGDRTVPIRVVIPGSLIIRESSEKKA